MNATGIASAAALSLLAGCFVLHETPYPGAKAAQVPEGGDVSVRLSGFKAEITEYVPVYGYETMYVDGWPYRRGGHYATVSSHAYVPQTRASEAFLERAQETMEENGFVLKAAQVSRGRVVLRAVRGGRREMGAGAVAFLLAAFGGLRRADLAGEVEDIRQFDRQGRVP